MKVKTEKTKLLPQRPKPAVGYIRVSTQGQGDLGISLEAQTAGINAFADANHYHVIEILKDVASAMGVKNVEVRSGLRRALQLAVENGAWVIVYDWSRLTRDVASIADIAELLPDPRRIVDAKTKTNFRQAVSAGEVARNEYVGKEIGRRTKAGMQKQRNEGMVFGNPNIKAVQEKGAEGVRSKAALLDATIADHLRSYGSMYGDLTAAEVADMLNEGGLLTGSGKPWNKTRVRLPLKRARKLLDVEQDERMRASPNFGAF